MGLVLWLPQLAILVTGPFSDLSRSLLRIISFHSLGKGQSRGRCKQYDLGTLPNADVRYGSLADLTYRSSFVRFVPRRRHQKPFALVQLEMLKSGKRHCEEKIGTGIGTEQDGTMRVSAVSPGRAEVRKSQKAGLNGTRQDFASRPHSV